MSPSNTIRGEKRDEGIEGIGKKGIGPPTEKVFRRL
jgi:hypothetical protein